MKWKLWSGDTPKMALSAWDFGADGGRMGGFATSSQLGKKASQGRCRL